MCACVMDRDSNSKCCECVWMSFSTLSAVLWQLPFYLYPKPSQWPISLLKEIVPCLCLNTHLSLTAYLSVVWKRVWERECLSSLWQVYAVTCLLCSPLSLSPVHQAMWQLWGVMGNGWLVLAGHKLSSLSGDTQMFDEGGLRRRPESRMMSYTSVIRSAVNVTDRFKASATQQICYS